jgi:hypothetical protein
MRARIAGLATVVAGLVVALGTPAGAQQLVDAGKEDGSGGLAFVIFAGVVMFMGASLFFMDRIRRRVVERQDSST